MLYEGELILGALSLLIVTVGMFKHLVVRFGINNKITMLDTIKGVGYIILFLYLTNSIWERL